MSEEMQLALEHTLKTMRELKEAKAEITTLRAEVERLRTVLREIEYLDRPQVRGLPRRVSIQEIAAAALAQEKQNG